MAQWQEREQNSINVNPVFVEFYDANRKLIDKSPNLNKSKLSLLDDSQNDEYLNSKLNGIPVRQIQKAKTEQAITEIGTEWCIAQSRELKTAGVPCIHYYTMSDGDVIKKLAASVI